MLELTGRSIAEQIAIGQLHFYRREPPVLAPRSQRGPQEELERFQQGQRQAVLQLAALYDRAFAEVGEETASIFAIHAMLLEDEDLVRTITDMIQREGATAEYAVKAAGDALAAAFGAMDSPYMRARSVDMRDISRRMLRALLGRRPKAPLTRPGTILVCEEFFPSEVMELDRRWLVGLAAMRGNVDSHTAHLLRAYHIPGMIELDLSPDLEWEGQIGLMDGFDNKLYLDPDRELMEKLRLRYQERGCPVGCGT